MKPLLLIALMTLTPMSAQAWEGCAGTRTEDVARELLPCGDRPNCVATNHTTPERQVSVPAGVTLAGLRAAALAEPRSRIIAEGENWFVAHFRSRLFGFIDEAHVIAHPDGRIDLRSGACTGYSDFDVNRKRVARMLEHAVK